MPYKINPITGELDYYIIDHNDLSGMDGGTTDQYYHMTSAQHSEVTTFFGSTDISAAEAETLTDTSDADALHTHNLKANLADPTFSGTATVPSTNFTVGTQVLTETNLTDLLDGGDTTLHDHDGISENTGARHTQGTDTTLGTMTADIDMDDTYQVVGLQAPAANGEAIRQTAKITEAALETVIDAGSGTAFATAAVLGTL